jgi:molecular chaperone HtpG
MPPTTTIQSPRVKLTGPVTIGKDTLELLSSGMYTEPLSIYREYVQNAADSLDDAAALRLRTPTQASPIEIKTNATEGQRTVVIRDYGVGVRRSSFIDTLTAIGASKKRGTASRGFRGIGRLAGLGYCQNLVMRSKHSEDSEVSCMHWDCKKLKELIRDPADFSVQQILEQVVEISTTAQKEYPFHFFEIEMCHVVSNKTDSLMSESAIRHYLSQIAPVPFDPNFSFAEEIQEFLAKHNAGTAYNLTVNGTAVFRPYQNSYEPKPKATSRFTKVEPFAVQGISGGADAVGWLLHGEYLGAIPERYGIEGLRLRCGNIQVGGARLVDALFPESRFNAWTIGECHVLSKKLIPNGRRDDFEQNVHYSNLCTHLGPVAKKIAKMCRDQSAERAKKRREAVVQQINGRPLDWSKARTFITKNGTRHLSKKERTEFRKILQNGTATYATMLSLLLRKLQSTKAAPSAGTKKK